MNLITPLQLLRGLKSGQHRQVIDVRSPGEFRDGALPCALNLPILDDDERHKVGLTHQRQGPAAAIEVATELVTDSQKHRTSLWVKVLESMDANAPVMCWRGGLRSQKALQWIFQAGHKTSRVEGGYKALRRILLESFGLTNHLWVLGGWTGSGKTQLIRQLSQSMIKPIDVEGAACHRGSCLGERWSAEGEIQAQPSQSSFENQLGLDLFEEDFVLIEDESTRIGSLHLPNSLKDQMKQSDVIFMDETEESRTERLFEEYIHCPLESGVSVAALQEHYIKKLFFLKKHLGGLRHSELIQCLRQAFETVDPEAHRHWIKLLLVEHYDRAYRHSFDRLDRKIRFKGNYIECLDFLSSAQSPK